MSFEPPKTHLYLEEDLPLIQLSHTYAQSSIWLENGMSEQLATYDLFVRDMPAHRNYMLFGGLQEILDWLQKIRFSESDIAYLLKVKLIDENFAKYLRNFKFTGTVRAMQEGTVFFPYEPVVRITAPLIEASIIETYMMSAATGNIMFMSKAARIKLAGQNKFAIGTGPFRAHSFESGAKACRAGYLLGMALGGQPAINIKYNIPVDRYVVNGQHLFITSYPDELSAFRALTDHYPEDCGFMVDTYNFEQGIENAIIVAKEMEARGQRLARVVIDSGDKIPRCRHARKRLDEENLHYVKIFLVGNLDEYSIAELAAADAPCDILYSITEYVTLSDSPKLEIVYKLAELRKGDDIHYAAKLATGKLSYPGRKQVYRTYTGGKITVDTLGLEGEDLGQPLLEKVMENGKLVNKQPNLEEIQTYVTSQLATIPEHLLDLHKEHKFEIKISGQLQTLLESTRAKHGAK